MTLDTLAFIGRCVVVLAIIFLVLRGLWLDRRKKVSYNIETDCFGIKNIHIKNAYHKFKK